jgi:hypothetical protein
MQSRKAGLALAALAVVAAVVLFIVLQDNGSDSGGSTTTTAAQGGSNGSSKREASIPTIVVRDEKPVGGVQDLSLETGERIQFIVKSDVTDEVHLHGYDVSKPVKAGGSVEFDVLGAIDGIFEVELEGRGVPLAEVTVNP